MRTNDDQAEKNQSKSDLMKLRDEILNFTCCYYCTDEDTGVLVEDLGHYGTAALPVLIEVLEKVPFPSPPIAACRILRQMGSAAREATPALLKTMGYRNSFEPHSVERVVEAVDRAIRRIRAYEMANAEQPGD